MRLIDADKLRTIRSIQSGDFNSIETIQKWIGNAPTVDAVPVVRCKDCRFYLQSNEKCELVDTRLRFYETDKTWTGDCFCSWGVRRDEDANSN